LDSLSVKMQETMEEFKGPAPREVEILQGFDLDPNDIDEGVMVNEIIGEDEIIQQQVVQDQNFAANRDKMVDQA
jgi:hypothetical protein